ncbi:conserved protein of unknown function [Shewanella benthica]|uniref:Uncharacterized protein n=1 Tax=Shewanella benthica TaxID=43661 RepID=A0A330M2Y6_9GAMM|nr:hypothetical protein [Shewanella benthica]SQH76966.1 conserved protein of unknown function [Shewanella benthica]
MILTKTPNTGKQHTEFRMLISIRFACLLSSTPNPMDCPRVQKRLAELNHYLRYNQASSLFYRSYCNQAGELGQTFALKVQDEQTATVYRMDKSVQQNVHHLCTHAVLIS